MAMQSVDPKLLIGLDHPDDAAVYQITEDTALVFTADFITPVVDDAYTWGAIAANNSMSDVYAMGGTPLIVLNLAGFPKDMPVEISRKVIEGGLSQVKEAGGLVVGGHTVEDEEPKFGLAVIGTVNPNRIIRKSGARPGDVLVLTKKLGSGLLAKCGKNSAISQEALDKAAASMLQSNRVASQSAVRANVAGGTDITGFALLGHAVEMADAASVRFRIRYRTIEFLPEALSEAQKGSHWPTKTFENQDHFSSRVEFQAALSEFEKLLLYSPETSGGLLLAVPEDAVNAFLNDLKKAGQAAFAIGQVEEGTGVVVEG